MSCKCEAQLPRSEGRDGYQKWALYGRPVKNMAILRLLELDISTKYLSGETA
ncbi:hypothetical protein Plhal710r2_c020g0086281 [Plasmopara halstedii]